MTEAKDTTMSDTAPAIAILPYGTKLGFRPGKMPLDGLNWPLGQPERLRGKTLRDMGSEDHLVVYPTGTAHFRLGFGTRARVSMMLVEPEAVQARHFRRLRWSHRRFYRVLSAQEDFLARIPNGLFLPFGSTWVPEWRDLDTWKRANVSLIASSKRDLEGHKLRHEIVEWAASEGIEMEVLGRGYKPFDRKSDGLAPYRFSVVIENVREPNYFTEKLVDAILSETVPIYWGCPNIDRFFDTGGLIQCETAQEVQDAIRAADAAEYESRLPALRAMKETAAHWGDVETRAAQEVLGAG